MAHPPKVAVIGSGISGLAAAHSLLGHADITLFEAGDYFGGHTHTVDVTLPTPRGLVIHGVDTGFLVYNERTYPHLINLLEELKVEVSPSDMSFSVQVPGAGREGGVLEWSGSSLATVFAQRANVLNPQFLRMLWDVLRFNRLAMRIAQANHDTDMAQTIGMFLDQHRFGNAFKNWYFLPMMGCIWSCTTDQMLQFPVATLIRFCYNHGLIQISNRPQWWTVKGGARHYVKKIIAQIPDSRLHTPVQLIERDAAGVRVLTAGRAERFDKVVVATHSDQALALLSDASPDERSILGAIGYQRNRAVLHTDASVLPQQRSAWAAWNYARGSTATAQDSVCLHYLINKLQPLPFSQAVIVTLNPLTDIAPEHVLGDFDYAHPIFDSAAIAAQKRLHDIQGQQHTYFCGAWTGYGFHEDGLKSGLAAARHFLTALHSEATQPYRQAA